MAASRISRLVPTTLTRAPRAAPTHLSRTFTSTPTPSADNSPFSAANSINTISRPAQTPKTTARSNKSSSGDLSTFMNTPAGSAPSSSDDSLLTSAMGNNLDAAFRPPQPHRLHVYAHKHNTHITLAQPPRSAVQTSSSRVSVASASAAEQKKMVDTLLSLSAGNIGFRKGRRGSYDAAYQLAAFALKQMQEKGMMREIRDLEVVLRGFGAGREAVVKALLGTEGRNLRGSIRAVVDATRLSQGSPRGKKPRRLG